MNVFVDLHHADLYYSLVRLFEERLGYKLYRPIGKDWFTEGYWKLAEPYGNAPDTINQYLDINDKGFDAFKNLNGSNYLENRIYHVFDPGHDYYQKAITLEQFKQMKFDIVISTFDLHEKPYDDLVAKFQPQAKRIVQLGNLKWESDAKNVMATVPFPVRPGQNAVFYHQEVDPKLFTYQPPTPGNKIFSFVNLLPKPEIYQSIKEAMPDIDFRAYGASCPEGSVNGAMGIAPLMKEANLGYHVKFGDGFGHVVMDWFSSGRPVITQLSEVRWYDSPDATKMYEDGVTCIDLDAQNLDETVARIRKALEPEENLRMCQATAQRFRELVNYDQEEQEIRKFLERLQ